MNDVSLPIDVLNLSTRSYNSLRRSGIKLMSELLALSEEDLYSFRNLGRKSADEILQKLQEFDEKKYIQEQESAEQQNSDTDIFAEPTEKQKKIIENYLKEKNIRIEDITELPVKAYNLLMINGYSYAYGIVFMTEEELMKIPRMDASSADMIKHCFYRYLSADTELRKYIEEEQRADNVNNMDIMMIRLMPEYRNIIYRYVCVNNVSTEALDISTRAKNSLLKNGKRNISDFIFLLEDEIRAFNGVSPTVANQIYLAIKNYFLKHKERIISVCNGNEADLLTDDAIISNIMRLYETDPFYGFNYNEIAEKLTSSDIVTEDRLKKIIGRLISEHRLEYVDYRCYRVYMSISDYIETGEHGVAEKYIAMFQRKCKGETLEAIAQEYGLTRERVRQLIMKAVRELSHSYAVKFGIDAFDEDYYRYFYETYELDRADAEKWFGITPLVLNYFECTNSKHGNTPLNKALEDMNLGAGLRMKVKNYINRNKIYVDNEYIEKRRDLLENFVVRKFCRDNVCFNDFCNIYNNFLRDCGVEYDEQLYYTDEIIRTRKNRLAESRCALWKLNEQIRYYDIDGRDYTELFDILNLDAYENTELSTDRFMMDYPEIMQKYDIRDQYELHNLLRKIVPEGGENNLQFVRMPNIRFGTFDRDAAIFDIIIDNSPVSAAELAEIIHDEYGYDKNTTMFTYLQPFAKYYYDGTYSVDFKDIPFERKTALQAELKDDFYYIDEIKKTYSDMFDETDTSCVNHRSLKAMGFSVFSRYAIHNYSSLEAYFEHLFVQSEIVDISGYNSRFATIQAYWIKMSNMKKSLEIIEFEPHKLINISRLEKIGVTKEKIKEFCNAVYDFVGDNTYFSIQSIRQDGFENELFELGFADWFYANLFVGDERFSHMRMFGTIMLFKGDAFLTIKAFLTEYIKKCGSIDIYILMNEINNRYGCRCDDKSDLVYKVQGTDIYYDRILERFYADENTYYRELDETEVF